MARVRRGFNIRHFTSSWLDKFEKLTLYTQRISDISPLANLTNLRSISLNHNRIEDISPLAKLINLEFVGIDDNEIVDISPLTKLTKLEKLELLDNRISDLPPLKELTNLKMLRLNTNKISDVSPLAGLINLERLDLINNEISDVSPLAALTNLDDLRLAKNEISDVSPLAGLTNLTWLDLSNNKISNFSPLDRLRENTQLALAGNPAFPKGGPKIEGPWLWAVFLEGTNPDRRDLLSKASGGMVTEVEIATHGATEGKSIGDIVWTSYRLPPAGRSNVRDMLTRMLKRPISRGVLYGSVSLYSLREQKTTMYVGSDRGTRVWLNGTLIYEQFRGFRVNDYAVFFSVTLQQGRNVLLVTVSTLSDGFFGFAPGTEYTVANPSIGYTFSTAPIHSGETFTLDIHAENVFDMAGWQFDIAFDPAALEAVEVTEGDFLKTDGGNTFFQSGSIDNAAGKIGDSVLYACPPKV